MNEAPTWHGLPARARGPSIRTPVIKPNLHDQAPPNLQRDPQTRHPPLVLPAMRRRPRHHRPRRPPRRPPRPRRPRAPPPPAPPPPTPPPPPPTPRRAL